MRSRVITALAGIPFVLGAMFCAKPIGVLSLLALVSTLSIVELHRLMPGKSSILRLVTAILSVALCVCFAVSPLAWGFSGIAFVTGVFSARYLLKSRSALIFGLACLWILVPIVSLFKLWQINASGVLGWWEIRTMTLMVLFPLWAGDSAGIFVGKAWGKHKLAPSISPNKTIEGAVANLLASMLLAYAVGSFLSLPPTVWMLCGLICGVFGQLGDLFESFLKRQAHVKDSGSLLPGHGGILDRVDSVLFSAPLVTMVLGFWR